MDSTGRFSSRVENYLKCRPQCPPAVIDWLKADGVLFPAVVVADIGSCTGFLAERFPRDHDRLFGVEPNREALGSIFAAHSVNGHVAFEYDTGIYDGRL